MPAPVVPFILVGASIVNTGLAITSHVLNAELTAALKEYSAQYQRYVTLQSSIQSHITLSYAYNAFLDKFKHDLVQLAHVELSAKPAFQKFQNFPFDPRYAGVALSGVRDTLRYFGLVLGYKVVSLSTPPQQQASIIVDDFEKNERIPLVSKSALQNKLALLAQIQSAIGVAIGIAKNSMDIESILKNKSQVEDATKDLKAAVKNLESIDSTTSASATEIVQDLKDLAAVYSIAVDNITDNFALLFALESALTTNSSPVFREFDDHTLRGIRNSLGIVSPGSQLNDIVTFENDDELQRDLSLYIKGAPRISKRAYKWFKENIFVKKDGTTLWDITNKYLLFCKAYYTAIPQEYDIYLCLQISKAADLLSVSNIADYAPLVEYTNSVDSI